MHKPRIYLFVLWFLDPNGSGKELTGGMERYCRDLALLYAEEGYSVTILQKSNVPFEILYSPNITVIGVQAKLTFGGHFTFFNAVKRMVPADAPVIYVSQDLCLGGYFRRGVGINHGIWWHGDFPLVKKIIIRLHQRQMLGWLKGIVCVDTNYINWMHAEFPERARWRHKLAYICNYADTTIFRPSEHAHEGAAVTIVFPRRMMGTAIADEPRGGLMFLQALASLKSRRSNLEFKVKMVGRGSLTAELQEWCNAHGLGQLVEFFEAAFDDMPKVYQSADVVVIPSTGTEGTSLSAIEAICSGATTVVTHIGGLGNIVLDGLNGYVSGLTAESLSYAIERAIDYPLDGTNSVSALAKDRWNGQIRNFVDKHLELT